MTVYTLTEWSPEGEREIGDFYTSIEVLVNDALGCYQAQIESPGWNGYVATYPEGPEVALKGFGGNAPDDAVKIKCLLDEALRGQRW